MGVSSKSPTAARAGVGNTVGLVLPGGGALGSYQVGVLRALTEAGVYADILIGVSAGSVNASLFAWNQGLDGIQRLEAIWRSIDSGSGSGLP